MSSFHFKIGSLEIVLAGGPQVSTTGCNSIRTGVLTQVMHQTVNGLLIFSKLLCNPIITLPFQIPLPDMGFLGWG